MTESTVTASGIGGRWEGYAVLITEYGVGRGSYEPLLGNQTASV